MCKITRTVDAFWTCAEHVLGLCSTCAGHSCRLWWPHSAGIQDPHNRCAAKLLVQSIHERETLKISHLLRAMFRLLDCRIHSTMLFGGGKGEIERTIERTAQFLQGLNPEATVASQARSFATAVNRSYLDAAVSFMPQIDIDSIIKSNQLVSGRMLQYRWADSGCSAQQGLKAMGELLGAASKVAAVIGPACSSACEVTSYLAGGQKIPQISWGCASPKLSDKDQYGLVRLPRPCLSLRASNVWDCDVRLLCSSLEQQHLTPAKGQR